MTMLLQRNLITTITAIVVIFILMYWSNPLDLLVPKDASHYATKMAATIQDRPECQQYKNQIMAHASGNPADGKTVAPIITAKQKATQAGCAKS